MFLLSLISSVYAHWSISPDWTISSDWSIEVDTGYYWLTLNINDPDNVTYNTASVPINLSISGNETNPAYSWNFQFTNGSWRYPANQTASIQTMSLNGNCSGVFGCYVIGDHSAHDYKEVWLSVTIIIPASDTYNINLVIGSPGSGVYINTVPVSLSITGNDTVSSYNWNLLRSNGSWYYSINHTLGIETVTVEANDTMTLCGIVYGNHLSSDYDVKAFMMYAETVETYVPTEPPTETSTINISQALPVILIVVMVGFVGGGLFIKAKRG